MTDRRGVATVFGGSGFIGRYVVARLAQRGWTVRVVGRHPTNAAFLRVAGQVGQVVPLYGSIMDPASLDQAVEGAEIVVNLVGILAEPKKGAFQRIHAQGAGSVAQAAARSGVRRLIHISAIGADRASPSAYARSKADGEAAVRSAFAAATVLRPSVVFGTEDKFFNMFGRMAQYLPAMPVPCGQTRFQPVYVGDVADAVMAATDREAHQGQLYELGGPKIWTMREMLDWVCQVTRHPRRLIAVPDWALRLQARLGELVPGRPFTRDQLILLHHDNVVGSAGTLATLGITPTPIELVVPGYLARYAPGGGHKGMIFDPSANRPR